MSKKICPREKEVIKGLHEEKMSEELQEHIAGCSVYQDTVAVSGWMKQLEESSWITGYFFKSFFSFSY